MTDRTPSAAAILRQIPFSDEIRRAAGDRRVYLVGGAVRDALRGLPTTDFDFVVAEPQDLAARLVGLLKGVVVPLHEQFPTARVVVRREGGTIDLDFAAPRAPSLRRDLRGRDFTMNALAAGPLGAHPRLFDPCGGRADLERRVVRMTSADSLMQDPLRILRAYRFAAQLGFRIDRQTRRQSRRRAHRIAEAATERIGAEVLALCAGEHFPVALEAAFSDGVLTALIPELGRAVGVEQLGVHEFDVAAHSVFTAQNLAGVMAEAPQVFADHASQIGGYLRDPDTRAALVLAGLLHDLGKPDCRVREGGRWRFFGHEERGTELAEGVVRRLRLPRRVRRQVLLLVGSHMRLIPYIRTDEPSDRAKRRLLRDTAPHTIGLVLLVIADWRALRGDQAVYEEHAALDRLRELFAVARGVAEATEDGGPPITGKDLISLGFEPGPRFGEILDRVEEEWLAGNLNTKSEALEWVRRRWALNRGRRRAARRPRR